MVAATVAKLSHLVEKKKYTEEVVLKQLNISLARGMITEFIGQASSGKSSLVLSIIAQLTKTGEICAVVDAGNGFNPISAVQNGVVIENLLWVKADNSIEKAFKSASLLAQAKGFGAIWLNLNGLDKKKMRSIPTTYWYSFRNLVKDTPTVLLVTAEEVVVGSATTRSFKLQRTKTRWSGKGRFKLLREYQLNFVSRKVPSEKADFNIEFRYDEI